MTTNETPKVLESECAWCGHHVTLIAMPGRAIGDGGREMWMNVDGPYCFDDSRHCPVESIVCTREGASSRTADELAAIFIIDTACLLGWVDESGWWDGDAGNSSKGKDDYRMACEVEGWCDDPDDSQELNDAIPVWEGYLSNGGYGVEWDDGYTIFKLAD